MKACDAPRCSAQANWPAKSQPKITGKRYMQIVRILDASHWRGAAEMKLAYAVFSRRFSTAQAGRSRPGSRNAT